MIWEGKTIESAIANALKEMNQSRENVEIEVLQEPVKGIFGLAKMAKIKVVLKENQDIEHKIVAEETESEEKTAKSESRIHTQASEQDRIKGYETLKNILNLMGISNFEIKSHIEEGNVILDIRSEAEGLLIGRHGKTREDIQYLVERICNTNEKEKVKYIIDIGGYLNRHKETLEKIAMRALNKVKETKKEEHLEAMSAYDRRIIHLFLKEDPEVKTYSIGEGGLRHIVVSPKT